MIKYICKKCNINTETSVCPVCGERAEMESSSIYWCDKCIVVDERKQTVYSRD